MRSAVWSAAVVILVAVAVVMLALPMWLRGGATPRKHTYMVQRQHDREPMQHEAESVSSNGFCVEFHDEGRVTGILCEPASILEIE